MSKQQPAVDKQDQSAERDMVDYLRAHPDFFARHDDLLLAMRIPHRAGVAVSLVERQVERLRAEIETMKDREREMHALARENEHLHGKLHRFTLQLIGAHSLSDVLVRVQTFLQTEFKVEPMVLLLSSQAGDEPPPQDGFCRWIEPDAEAFTAFDACLKSERAICGRLKHEQLRILFGERAVEIRSTAFMALGDQGKIGMLAIGSLEEHRFDDRMGTVFLDNMADVISQAIHAQC